ncbi:MAG: hypothetical protein ACR2GC_09905 [Methyloceanibacter sp.]|uniref:hypothetical protein n=1 Tax=Methyloceanibacter sp. TaxID=1965321 RepID=UPI003D9B34F7
MKNSLIGLFTLFVSIELAILPASAEPILQGFYKSLDGKFGHNFKSSGDYSVTIFDGAMNESANGLFQQVEGLCWSEPRGGPRILGNVLLYIDQVQCCLKFRAISDKYAVTKVWVKGTGLGYGICTNQVVIKGQ